MGGFEGTEAGEQTGARARGVPIGTTQGYHSGARTSRTAVVDKLFPMTL